MIASLYAKSAEETVGLSANAGAPARSAAAARRSLRAFAMPSLLTGEGKVMVEQHGYERINQLKRTDFPHHFPNRRHSEATAVTANFATGRSVGLCPRRA